jgi:hypothetical protein
MLRSRLETSDGAFDVSRTYGSQFLARPALHQFGQRGARRD